MKEVKRKIITQSFMVYSRFPVVFTRDVFSLANPELPKILSSTGRRNKILLVIDSEVFNSTVGLMDKMEKFADCHNDILEFSTSPFIMRGGEVCKNDLEEVNKVHELISKHHICRHSFVLAIGGGAVLDSAGYATATAHRGVRLIRMPTTTLAQNDSGVGVKNGVNRFGRKNFCGTFAPPFAVINDFNFLETLSDRNKRAGIAEAVKVSLIKDREFFDYLYKERHNIAAFVPDVMEKMIVWCAELHIEHIGRKGDPFEHGTSRPLDFGHWSAHKMEEMTGGKILHGEAVAIGIAMDCLYCHYKGLISELELHKILSLLENIGFDLYHWSLGWIDFASALKEFQEHLGGELTIPLLNGIGSIREAHEMDTYLLKKCVNILAAKYKGKEKRDDFIKQLPDVSTRGSGKILP